MAVHLAHCSVMQTALPMAVHLAHCLVMQTALAIVVHLAHCLVMIRRASTETHDSADTREFVRSVIHIII